MSNTDFSSDEIYTGFWVDHHSGSATGLTLTISSSSSVYLIAFLALFVRVAGNHLWNLFCYVVFHVRTTPKKKDGLYHQEQQLLRSGISDFKSALAFLRLGHAWKGKAQKPLSRVLPLTFVAIFHVAALAIAGIFSSKIAQVHSTVLLRNGTCGDFSLDFGSNVKNIQANDVAGAMQHFAASFVEQCYEFNSTSKDILSPDCDAHGRRKIQWTIDDTILCPFQPQMCRNDLAVRFDTGFIDSNYHLGINTPDSDSVMFRIVINPYLLLNATKTLQTTDCTPLQTEGFVDYNVSESQSELGPLYIDSAFPYRGFSLYNYGW